MSASNEFDGNTLVLRRANDHDDFDGCSLEIWVNGEWLESCEDLSSNQVRGRVEQLEKILHCTAQDTTSTLKTIYGHEAIGPNFTADGLLPSRMPKVLVTADFRDGNGAVPVMIVCCRDPKALTEHLAYCAQSPDTFRALLTPPKTAEGDSDA